MADQQSSSYSTPARSKSKIAKYIPGLGNLGSGSKKNKLKHRHSVDPTQLAALKAKSQRTLGVSSANDAPPPGQSRSIALNGGDVKTGFTGNSIRTSKYNLVTFLPKFLYEMFSRAAYLYFLIQACLAWWSTVSPYGGFGSTAALVFVLLVAAVKSIYEDVKRHHEDSETNNSIAHVLQPDGTWKDIPWRKVAVGQLLKVFDNELFPADLLCLKSQLMDGVCFIRTTNLDGETNLKVRSTLATDGFDDFSEEDWIRASGTLLCELPNAELHTFKGRFQSTPPDESSQPRTTAVTMNEMLLRGCMLKNSGHIIGLVVYTGAETRIQMNSAETPLKYGSFDNFLNIQIMLIILLQLTMCVLHGGLNLWWRNTRGRDRYFLALNTEGQGNYNSNVAQFFINLVTFWILYSYLVPISLFVTMEIVKFWQGFIFVNRDPEMVDAMGKGAKARNSNLNEDLGKVTYVFSDKTGTLTSNEMQLRQIALNGKEYGNMTWKMEEHPEMSPNDALKQWDQQLHTAAQQQSGGLTDAQRTFWTAILVCNTLIVEEDTEHNGFSYQGPSPDEVALVQGASRLGFSLAARSSDNLTLRLPSGEEQWRVLNVLEYSSARARMSVIARDPNGQIHLFCKGADTKVMDMVRGTTEGALLQKTEHNLHDFAVNGLRTLVVASRRLEEDEWSTWDDMYQTAAADLEHRETLIAQRAEEVEADLQLAGVTAIEDKLQDGVPSTIQTLLAANIKVWVITGDKQETAINIAISCRLILNPDSLLICNSKSYDEARDRLRDLLPIVQKARAVHKKPVSEMVIDGKTLSYILDKDTEQLLAEIGSYCSGVIICRASPSQKASIVGMMRQWELRQAGGVGKSPWAWWRRMRFRLQGKMLAIGDGANDVAMIQSANIGVGIMGKEGRQAVNNSDYAIGQFRFLARLLLVHGTLSHYRLARLIRYSFMKNVLFCFMLFFYQFYCGFSGQTLVDGVAAAVYNVLCTSVPILLFAVLDRPVHYFATLMRYPQMYNRGKSMATVVFWRYSVFTAMIGGAIVFFFCYYGSKMGGRDANAGLYSVGKTVYICIVLMVNVEVLMFARYWTKIFVATVILSYVAAYAFLLLYQWVNFGFNLYDPAQNGVIYQVMKSASFWLLQIATLVAFFGYRFLDRAIVWNNHPHDDMLLSEHENKDGGPLVDLDESERTRLLDLGVAPRPDSAGISRMNTRTGDVELQAPDDYHYGQRHD